MEAGNRHIHYDCIVAWAKGHKIQCRLLPDQDWQFVESPTWGRYYEYRVFKEPTIEEIDILLKLVPEYDCGHTIGTKVQLMSLFSGQSPNATCTFIDGKLTKVEVK